MPDRMLLVFIHGWGTTHTKSYGELPEALQNAAHAFGLELDIQHIFLGRYISFQDQVTMDDLAEQH